MTRDGAPRGNEFLFEAEAVLTPDEKFEWIDLVLEAGVLMCVLGIKSSSSFAGS